MTEKAPWYNRKWAFRLYIILLLFPLIEIAVRIVGYAPYANSDYSICSEPKNCLTADSLLGLRLSPGAFTVTINKHHHYTAHHTSDNQRLVVGCIEAENQKKVALLGCSFTYGMGVNDDQTFASLLQKKHPELFVANLGVPGYGTVQSLLQLQSIIDESKQPDLVVLTFSDLHFERNTLSPSYRRALKYGFENSNPDNRNMLLKARFPFYLDGVLSYENWSNIYTGWNGRSTFAIINFLNILADQSTSNSIDEVGTTKKILTEIMDLCRQSNIAFKICFLENSSLNKKLMAFCQNNNIEYTIAGINHTDKTLTNLPHDSHPNMKGHQIIANKILPWLDTL